MMPSSLASSCFPGLPTHCLLSTLPGHASLVLFLHTAKLCLSRGFALVLSLSDTKHDSLLQFFSASIYVTFSREASLIALHKTVFFPTSLWLALFNSIALKAN